MIDFLSLVLHVEVSPIKTRVSSVGRTLWPYAPRKAAPCSSSALAVARDARWHGIECSGVPGVNGWGNCAGRYRRLLACEV